MLLNGIPMSCAQNLKQIASYMKGFSEKSHKLSLKHLDIEIRLMKSSPLIQESKLEVIYYYLGLSVAALHTANDRLHWDKESKYPRFERFVSPHEDVVAKRLTERSKIPFIRQLLIGGSHADIYIPALHLCIEPSSERYFSNGYRTIQEKKRTYERALHLNELHTLWTENFNQTPKLVDSVINDYRVNRRTLKLDQITDNLLQMACFTIPRFIPYGEFYRMIQDMPLPLVDEHFINDLLDRT